jgi:hypothetical protein
MSTTNTPVPRTCQLEGCDQDISHKRADARYCSRDHYEKARNSTPERKEAQSRPARRQRVETKRQLEAQQRRRQKAPKPTKTQVQSFGRQLRRIKARLRDQAAADPTLVEAEARYRAAMAKIGEQIRQGISLEELKERNRLHLREAERRAQEHREVITSLPPSTTCKRPGGGIENDLLADLNGEITSQDEDDMKEFLGPGGLWGS